MVKAKKGKKDAIRDEELNSDVDVKTTNIDNDSDSELVQKTKKTKDKKKGGGKKEVREENSEDDDDSEIEKLAKNVKKLNVKGKGKKKSKVSDEDNDSDQEVSNKKSSNKSKKGGFALLNVDSDNDDDVSDNEQKQLSDEEEVQVKTSKKGKPKRKDSLEEDVKTTKEQQAGGKKSKKGKKKRNDTDEDIDQVLAELALEYAGEKKENETATEIEPVVKKDKKSKKISENKDDDGGEDDNDDEAETGGGGIKSAAQKKKEKKERQKRDAALAKQQGNKKKPVEKQKSIEDEQIPMEVVESIEITSKDEEKSDVNVDGEVKDDEEAEGGTKGKDDKKKKKKGVKGEEKKEEKGRKGPSKAVVAAMQEQLKKMKEEEERLKREEEEQERIADEIEEMRLEQIRLENERREKRKQKEKERKDRLKAEGKLLSTKQKMDKARAQAMLESLKVQGLDLPEAAEKRVRPGTRLRPKKNLQNQDQSSKDDDQLNDQENEEPSEENEMKDDGEGDEEVVTPEVVVEVVKEAWDVSSSSEDESQEIEKPVVEVKKPTKVTAAAAATKTTPATKTPAKKSKVVVESESSSDDSDDDDDDDDSDESEVEMNEEQKVDAEMRKQRVRLRIAKRRSDAEQKQTVDNLRAAVVCVLGHVDTGKTKILDKLRRTNVQDGEAGGITQQIGATNVPIEAIKEQTKIVKGFAEMNFKLPGLLIIDTPGHESFSNLRNRGSSLCDIAILVVDIMHGLEPQTIESLNLLKSRKTPFVVALNKIDRLYDWQTMSRKDVRDGIKGQQSNTHLEFTQRTKEVIVQFAEQGLNAALFYENPDPRTYVSMVPTSAITGEGMGNLLFLIIESCQTLLAKRLMYSEDLLATVLEVKAIPGLGTTIDAILINGKLREGETMIVAGTDGPIVTQIRSLLMPQPMKELRVKNAYVEYKEIIAAQGVKIAAKELEKAIAGLNLQIAQKPDEVEIFKEEVAKELKSALSSIKLSALGVYVQASTLGSLEALLEYLRTSKIPYAGIRIGPVVKRDVMKASTMLEHEAQYSTILAFDVKIERDAQDLADSLGVKIFQADIIYHLFDKFMAYRDDLKKKKRDEFKSIAVFPCKLKIIPQFIFNSRDPIVMGVMVEAGVVKEGTPICVPSKEFVELGIVTSIEFNHKQIEMARKGQEVCIKIEPIPGDSPKMFGRHFEETDMLVSKISRQSIDACKEYFRDDLVKADWALMVDLKKQFQIL